MRKLITFFSTISLLFSSISSVTACNNVDIGDQIKINIGNEPTKQKLNQDPLTDYVYNDNYYYDNGHLGYIKSTLAKIMQLALDKIKSDKFKSKVKLLKKDAQAFYESKGYNRGHFSDINYNWNKSKLKHPFTTKDKNEALLVSGLTDDDVTKNQYFAYWFVTSETASKTNFLVPDLKTSIKMPYISEFDKNKITREGWIHLFLTINGQDGFIYKIDFDVRITFTFILHVDKNDRQIVLVDSDTFKNPLGVIDFANPDKTFDGFTDAQGKEIPGRIDNMVISRNIAS